MKKYLVSRHHGAVEWMKRMGHEYDEHLTHLPNYDGLQPGDTVIGTLPINVVAEINLMGVRYIHLSLNLPQHLRGIELSVQQLSELNVQLEAFYAELVS